MATAARDRCPKCGAERPADAPRGHCPRCLIREALEGESLSLSRGGDLGATVDLGSNPGVLDTLAASVGMVPRVLLRGTDPGAEPPVMHPPDPAAANPSIRYRLDGEIARGGMGQVLKGRDPDLGRDVALKVLRDDLADRPEMVRRFVEEAQIGGQLQHPGIVPIYELGTFADRRPFFSMKLVKGQTLFALLADRQLPADDLPRFLGIFEAISQTMAYAHARGVIHRDLKPSNVMVGSFGEVQVMDWGLAKVLPRGGVADDAAAGKVPDQETVIATARNSGDSDVEPSHAGSVMGTPAYMAPEQARGEIERIDERADVFALGSILCEVLTGQPAFTGSSSAEILRVAARADTAEALARLESCKADSDLVGLARDCLAAGVVNRPRDARAVADRATAYLSGVQERLHAAELERAAAQARAAEERKRHKLELGLAAALLSLVALGTLGAAYELSRRNARDTRVAQVLAEANALLDRAGRHREETTRWREALAAVQRIEEEWDADLGDDARAQLVALRTDARDGLRDAVQDEELLRKLAEIRIVGSFQLSDLTDEAYSGAFREAGLDIDMLPVAEANKLLRRRPEPVVRELVAYLDHWATSRHWMTDSWRKLLQVVRAVDPDPHRDKVRGLLLAARTEKDVTDRRQALQEIAADPLSSEFSGPTAVLLGYALALAGDMPGEAALLERVVARHPDDIWANAILGLVLRMLGRPEDAARSYAAARVLRPEAGILLATMLPELGRHDEAERIYADVAGRMSDQPYPLEQYGLFLRERGRAREAAPILDRAVAAHRAQIARRPGLLQLRRNLLKLLTRLGSHDESVALCREAARAVPQGGQLYLYFALDMAREGRIDEAIAAYHEGTRTAEVTRTEPGWAMLHHEFGAALAHQDRRNEAIAAFREAIRLDPDHAPAHCFLGLSLRQTGNFSAALAELRLGHELGSKRPNWRFPSAEWLRQAEQFAALGERLPALHAGNDRPRDAAERLALCQMCYDTKRYSAASRLWADAMVTDPKLGDDRVRQHRYNAACASALAAAGKGRDEPQPDEMARARLRSQALVWLQAELAAWSKVLASADPKSRNTVAQTFRHWKQDPDLAGVRDADVLAKLPEAEREEWQALWARAESLLGQASNTP